MHSRFLTGSCALLALLLVLSGCGQTGPLYLPDKTPPKPPEQEQSGQR